MSTNSTTLRTVPIKDIQLDDRIRKTFNQDALDKLSESMRTSGVIHPLVLDDNLTLVAGERRLRAAQLLGWSEVPCTIRSGLTDWDRQVIELEENIRREALTYVEEITALEKLHTLYQTKHGPTQDGRAGGWKVRDTADLLGISAGAASQDLQLAKAIKTDPELAQQKTKIAARSMMVRKQSLNLRQIAALVTSKPKPKTDNQSLTELTTADAEPEPAPVHLHLGSCLDLLPDLPDDSVACLLTDPPWGVDFDAKFKNPNLDAFGLIASMLAAVRPKLQPGALCWMFCATKHLITGELYRLILDSGYSLFPQIFIWYKPSVAFSSHPFGELKNDYEPALLFSLGPARPLTKPSFAVFSSTIKGRRIHPAQKPLDVLQHLIDISTTPNELILDPFAGSASTLVAAGLTGRRALGYELMQDFFDIGIMHLRENLSESKGEFSYDTN